MSKKESLERLASKKEEIKPVVEKAIDEFLGVQVPTITEDISDRLLGGGLDFDIDLNVPFKDAREEFKKQYLIQLLQQVNGNISEAARISGLDRRTLHRLIKQYSLSIEQARQAPYQFRDEKKDNYVKRVVEETLQEYDIVSDKYKNIDENTTKKISRAVAQITMSIDIAIALFERAYLEHALQKWKTTKEAASNIGLRYETVHKKAKELKLLE